MDRRRWWFVAVFMLLAAAFHVFSQSQRHLWADEASTYWTVQARVVDLLRGARTDGTPPLYFLIVSAVTQPERLVHEGEALAETLAGTARQGHAVWVLLSGPDH